MKIFNNISKGSVWSPVMCMENTNIKHHFRILKKKNIVGFLNPESSC